VCRALGHAPATADWDRSRAPAREADGPSDTRAAPARVWAVTLLIVIPASVVAAVVTAVYTLGLGQFLSHGGTTLGIVLALVCAATTPSSAGGHHHCLDPVLRSVTGTPSSTGAFPDPGMLRFLWSRVARRAA
jgi:hypothetical protein